MRSAATRISLADHPDSTCLMETCPRSAASPGPTPATYTSERDRRRSPETATPPTRTATRNRRFALLVAAFAGVVIARSAEPPGHIRIDAEGGLQVFLDGQLRGATSDAKGGLLLENVPSGEHRLTVVKAGFAPDEQPLTVRPGFVAVAATFALIPSAETAGRGRNPQPIPLRAIDQARAALAAAESADASARRTPPEPASKDPGYAEAVRQHAVRQQDARTALTAARRTLTDVEAAVSARFRADYAAFRRLEREPGVAAERKRAAWQELSATWQLPAEDRPATLVWRNRRPEIARGNLHIRVGPAWPAQLDAPAVYIDNRKVSLQTETGGDARTWSVENLPASTHLLRIEHPAIEPSVAEFTIRDGMATSVNWTPQPRNRRRP